MSTTLVFLAGLLIGASGWDIFVTRPEIKRRKQLAHLTRVLAAALYRAHARAYNTVVARVPRRRPVTKAGA